ncbi:unnamed protein product [Echinostoma caproni]|uniref:Uncharacterized protein n=1 Tax=Echinostoma caproni TaxID=27848 RepID=A0A3P8KV71_9TREM|nr:unnamed protein product [Echinostoma caproni]
MLHYEQVAPTPLPPDASVRVHIPGHRVPPPAAAAAARPTSVASPNQITSDPRASVIQKVSRPASVSSAEDSANPLLDTEPPESVNSNDPSQLTHEKLTPTHRLEVSDMKLRWTEHTRDLVYMLMDTYQHAQSLKRNLSARATQAFHLDANSGGRIKPTEAVQSGLLGLHNRVASTASNLTSRTMDPTINEPTSMSSRNTSHSDIRTDQVNSTPTIATATGSQGSLDIASVADAASVTADRQQHPERNTKPDLIGSPQASDTQTRSDRSWLPGLGRVPMLAQLLDEVDTARFYAYCEEEPKQTDVMGQLQGLNICASSPVIARNWHVELVNSQLLLKTHSLAGYVLVTAARAKLNALAHPPIWRDAQLLTKSSLVGHLEGMQYFATVGQLLPSYADQWLSTADVSDWAHLNPSADEDALSGRPEVVGCGRSVGGVVNAAYVTPVTAAPMGAVRVSGAQQTIPIGIGGKSSMGHAHSALLTATPSIQLQRMISRCSCQVFYVHYEPVDPAKLPAPHLIPPLLSEAMIAEDFWFR